MCPIKLQHVQLLGQPTGTLAFVGMLIGDNRSHVEVRMSIYGQRWPRSNPADLCKSPRKVRNVTRRIFHRLFPDGHDTKCDQTLPLTVKGVACIFPCYGLIMAAEVKGKIVLDLLIQQFEVALIR